jgi:comEA protein
LKLSKAETLSIIITLIFVAAVIIISLWSGKSDSSVSVTFQNTNSADAIITPSVSPAAAESPSASGSESTSVPSSSPAAAVSSVVPSPSPSVAGSSSSAKPSASSIININTASASELCSLPGIGEVLAGRIVAYREAHGAFKSTGEIMNVSGIGTAKYKAIKDLIAVN